MAQQAAQKVQPTASQAIEQMGLSEQNKATIGRLVLSGGIARAEEANGRMHAEVRIVKDQLIWSPSVIVMPHGGDIDLDIYNDDDNTHCGMFPSNGDNKFIWLLNRSHGTASLNLDGPGYYWFSSPIGNDEGRGLVGVLVVEGDVAPEARLDRPPQPRP